MKLTAKEHRKIAQSYFDNGNLDSSHIKFSTAKKVGDWIFIKEDQEVLLYFLKNTYCEAETGWDSKSFDWSQKNLNKLVHEYVKKTSSNAEYMEYLGYEFCLVSNQKEDIPLSKHKHCYDDYPYHSENGYVVVIPFKKEHLLLVKNFLITYQKWCIECVGPTALGKDDYKLHRKAMDYYHDLIDLKIFTDTREYEIDWKLFDLEDLIGQKKFAWRSFDEKLTNHFPKIKDFDNFFEVKND